MTDPATISTASGSMARYARAALVAARTAIASAGAKKNAPARTKLAPKAVARFKSADCIRISRLIVRKVAWVTARAAAHQMIRRLPAGASRWPLESDDGAMRTLKTT